MVVTNPPASLCFSQQQYTMILKVIVINVALKRKMGGAAQGAPLRSPSPFDAFHEG